MRCVAQDEMKRDSRRQIREGAYEGQLEAAQGPPCFAPAVVTSSQHVQPHRARPVRLHVQRIELSLTRVGDRA
jgi:hypothetical protein